MSTQRIYDLLTIRSGLKKDLNKKQSEADNMEDVSIMHSFDMWSLVAQISDLDTELIELGYVFRDIDFDENEQVWQPFDLELQALNKVDETLETTYIINNLKMMANGWMQLATDEGEPFIQQEQEVIVIGRQALDRYIQSRNA